MRAEVRNPKGVAVIVGNADYEDRDVPDVSFARRDADAFRRYVVDVVGFDPENVIDLRDARRREMIDALGSARNPRGKLWSYLDPEGGSDVMVFYSGHGVPGKKDKRGYLLPVDGSPQEAEEDGYPLDLLYRNLGNLKEARSVVVYLDAGFSGRRFSARIAWRLRIVWRLNPISSAESTRNSIASLWLRIICASCHSFPSASSPSSSSRVVSSRE